MRAEEVATRTDRLLSPQRGSSLNSSWYVEPVVMVILENTIIRRDIQCPADMVEIFDTGGTAAALQILLEGYRMVKQMVV